MIETWMLALTRDEVAIVRAAATKALGCFISFPSLKQVTQVHKEIKATERCSFE
jgi:hypothetical protein